MFYRLRMILACKKSLGLTKEVGIGKTPPHPCFLILPTFPVFCCCRRPLIVTLLSPCLCHKKIRERLTVEYGECGAECLLGLTFPEAACRELLWSGPLTTNISSKKWHQDTKLPDFGKLQSSIWLRWCRQRRGEAGSMSGYLVREGVGAYQRWCSVQCDAGSWWVGTQSVSGLYLSNRRRKTR